MKRTGLLWLSVVAILAAGCSKSEPTTAKASESPARGAAVSTTGAGRHDKKSDENFVHDVAIMNLAELELSRMALTKASPDVKVFAQKLIEDHTAAGDKLKSAVSGSDANWPTQLDDKSKRTADDLAKKQGSDFDLDYVKAMVDGHQDLTATLESRLDLQTLADWKAAAAGRAQSKALPDPKSEMPDVQIRPEKSDKEITMRINQWAADTYPVAQKHLDTARMLKEPTKKRSTN
jgi:predicted outer membrane protein